MMTRVRVCVCVWCFHFDPRCLLFPNEDFGRLNETFDESFAAPFNDMLVQPSKIFVWVA